jgi:serine/threonine protein kinase
MFEFDPDLTRFTSMMQYVEVDKSSVLEPGTCSTVYAGVRRAAPGQSWPEIEVAVSVFYRPSVNKEDTSRLFNRDVDIMARLDHPACIQLVAFDAPADGDWWVVTPKMSTDLQKLIDAEANDEEPDGWDATAKSIVAFGIASGLAYLHSNNIVHRNIKPSNILLDSNFYPRISDFVISRVIPRGEEVELTMQVGTPLYMAPEMRSDGT